jgi:hypothetical protein
MLSPPWQAAGAYAWSAQNLDERFVDAAGRLRTAPLTILYNAARQIKPSSNCTSTASPAATLPVAVSSTMKQLACDIDDRMPEP